MRTVKQTSPPSFEKVWLMFQETDKRFQESEKLLTQKFQDTDKTIKELSNLFKTQWGKLVEALIEPGCLRLFQERGIKINYSYQNVKAVHGRETMELDVLLVNTNELVVVEIKTTCRPLDVTEFADKMLEFRKHFPHYKDYKIYGALAALKYDGQSDKLAYRNGLFALKSTGEGIIKISNDKKFAPKAF